MENIKQNLPAWITIWSILGFGWIFDLSIPITNMSVIIILLLFMTPIYKTKPGVKKYNPNVDIPDFLKK